MSLIKGMRVFCTSPFAGGHLNSFWGDKNFAYPVATGLLGL